MGQLGRHYQISNVCIPVGPVTLLLEFFPREHIEIYKLEVGHSISIIEKNWKHHTNVTLRIG